MQRALHGLRRRFFPPRRCRRSPLLARASRRLSDLAGPRLARRARCPSRRLPCFWARVSLRRRLLRRRPSSGQPLLHGGRPLRPHLGEARAQVGRARAWASLLGLGRSRTLLTEMWSSWQHPRRSTMERTAVVAGALVPGLARALEQPWLLLHPRPRCPRRVVGMVSTRGARSGSVAATGRRVASGATHPWPRSALAVTAMVDLRRATRQWRETGRVKRLFLSVTAVLPRCLDLSATRPQAFTSRLLQPFVAVPRAPHVETAAATRTVVAIGTGTVATETAAFDIADRIGRPIQAGGTGLGGNG